MFEVVVVFISFGDERKAFAPAHRITVRVSQDWSWVGRSDRTIHDKFRRRELKEKRKKSDFVYDFADGERSTIETDQDNGGVSRRNRTTVGFELRCSLL